MWKSNWVIGGLLGGIGALFLGVFKVSINSEELSTLLELVTQYFPVISSIVLLYMYFILQKEHESCLVSYREVSRELSSLKSRLIRLEYASKD